MTNEVEDTTLLLDLNPHFLTEKITLTLLIAMQIIKKNASPTPFRQNKTVPASSGNVSIPSNFVRSSGYHLSV